VLVQYVDICSPTPTSGMSLLSWFIMVVLAPAFRACCEALKTGTTQAQGSMGQRFVSCLVIRQVGNRRRHLLWIERNNNEDCRDQNHIDRTLHDCRYL